MAFWHGDKGKTATGAQRNHYRKKRKYELGSLPLLPKLEKDKRVLKRTKGGGTKIKAHSIEFVNVLNPKTREVKKVKILTVLENTANPHFVRRNVITKGCVVKTELGKAKVTSRPSQHGIVSAILLESK